MKAKQFSERYFITHFVSWNDRFDAKIIALPHEEGQSQSFILALQSINLWINVCDSWWYYNDGGQRSM